MPSSPTFDIELTLLLEAVYQRYQHDFRHYARSSLARRLRQAMEDFGCRSLSHLQERLLHEPEVFARLLGYFTVQVSEMFRDPPYFRALREQVLPVLKTYPSVKIWVAGCSSGEEVWSLAILLAEEDMLDRAVLYATDINPDALHAAETGIYPLDRVAQYSQSYRDAGGKRSLSDYYTAGEHGVIFDRALRRGMVFADHSLATDSVFSEVHLVSCRNVLIYFDRELQQRALGLFLDALTRRGFLGLGNRETLRFSGYETRFSEFCAEERIYQKS
ncbi:CheR family methyltransferase [Noviherbaspirillum pedocola]|uniref:Protein-glutamate O-methyltransferase CheR n=1 Tax=Noviherbaspirillum pedocola TaxID=2801341 RepID=A0A934SUG5_9BURK|nr:protein-glutamate O-methyltransferase CheR [Noviherbaspirillum pedocola]MBK4735665.1 protein-glutamate O-methyltransferase CheR [Noviherbaspirillum pedocola]